MRIYKRIQIIFLALWMAFVFEYVPAQAAGITAVLSPQSFYVNNKPVEMTAYSIGDNNYIRLRDIGKAVDFYVFYDHSTDAVYLYNSVEYMESADLQPPVIREVADAELSGQMFRVNNEPYAMLAYSINDNNYVKLRDVGEALNFCVSYDAETDSVVIDKSLPYGTETTLVLPEETPHDGRVPITEKVLDGSEWAREDFSRQANPAIFDDVYTRGMYNAFRQSIVDRDIIIENNLEEYTVEMEVKPINKNPVMVSVTSDNFNPIYRYAHYIDREATNGSTWKAMNEVRGKINGEIGLYIYIDKAEPYVRNVWEYPGYRIITPYSNYSLAPANAATDNIIAEVNGIATEREKIKRLNDYLCTKLVYDVNVPSSINEVFTSSGQSKGFCATYAKCFSYLCERANIPCLMLYDDNHGWNSVYVKEEKKWLIVDATWNDEGSKSNDRYLMIETHTNQDAAPASTIFAMELLVPFSTVK